MRAPSPRARTPCAARAPGSLPSSLGRELRGGGERGEGGTSTRDGVAASRHGGGGHRQRLEQRELVLLLGRRARLASQQDLELGRDHPRPVRLVERAHSSRGLRGCATSARGRVGPGRGRTGTIEVFSIAAASIGVAIPPARVEALASLGVCGRARAGMLASGVRASALGRRLGTWRRLTMLICGPMRASCGAQWAVE